MEPFLRLLISSSCLSQDVTLCILLAVKSSLGHKRVYYNTFELSFTFTSVANFNHITNRVILCCAWNNVMAGFGSFNILFKPPTFILTYLWDWLLSINNESLLTVTVTHPRCSICFKVFNSRLAEHNWLIVTAITFSPCSKHSASLFTAVWCQGLLHKRQRGQGVQPVCIRQSCHLMSFFCMAWRKRQKYLFIYLFFYFKYGLSKVNGGATVTELSWN